MTDASKPTPAEIMHALSVLEAAGYSISNGKELLKYNTRKARRFLELVDGVRSGRTHFAEELLTACVADLKRSHPLSSPILMTYLRESLEEIVQNKVDAKEALGLVRRSKPPSGDALRRDVYAYLLSQAHSLEETSRDSIFTAIRISLDLDEDMEDTQIDRMIRRGKEYTEVRNHRLLEMSKHEPKGLVVSFD